MEKSCNIPRLVEHSNEEKASLRIHVHLDPIASATILSGIPRTNKIAISDGGVQRCRVEGVATIAWVMVSKAVSKA